MRITDSGTLAYSACGAASYIATTQLLTCTCSGLGVFAVIEQHVGCDGVAGSVSTLDACGVCGGTTTSCDSSSPVNALAIALGVVAAVGTAAGAALLRWRRVQSKPKPEFNVLNRTGGGTIDVVTV